MTSMQMMVNTEPWILQAVCSQRDPEIWFPTPAESNREAKKICEDCPVRSECLEYALRTDQRYGIWGGASESERRKLKRKWRIEGQTKRHSSGILVKNGVWHERSKKRGSSAR